MASDLYSRSGGAVGVEGLASTLRTMKALGESDQAIKDALKVAAETLAAASKDTVPVGKPGISKHPGRLRSTIRTSVTTRGAFVIAGNKGAPYANPIHWGWFVDRKSERAKNSRRGYLKRNILPQPFFAKALGYTKQEIYQNFLEVMEREVNQTVRRGIGGRNT